MSTRQYVGARYVPLFVGEWDMLRPYEALTVVTYLGSSYTSKKAVPAGIDLSDTEYWVSTGNYNAQIEQYREEVMGLRSGLLNGELVSPAFFASDEQPIFTVRNQAEFDAALRKVNSWHNCKIKFASAGTYKVGSQIGEDGNAFPVLFHASIHFYSDANVGITLDLNGARCYNCHFNFAGMTGSTVFKNTNPNVAYFEDGSLYTGATVTWDCTLRIYQGTANIESSTFRKCDGSSPVVNTFGKISLSNCKFNLDYAQCPNMVALVSASQYSETVFGGQNTVVKKPPAGNTLAVVHTTPASSGGTGVRIVQSGIVLDENNSRYHVASNRGTFSVFCDTTSAFLDVVTTETPKDMFALTVTPPLNRAYGWVNITYVSGNEVP